METGRPVPLFIATTETPISLRHHEFQWWGILIVKRPCKDGEPAVRF